MIGWEDSPPSTILPLPSIENTSTVSGPDPPASEPPAETDRGTSPAGWDKTLSWEKTLAEVNLLKSVGNGSEVFVRPTTNNISRNEPVHLTIWL